MISVMLNQDPCHWAPIFDKEGNFSKIDNIVDSWLIKRGIAFTKEPVMTRHEVHGVNKVDYMEARIGHKYLFEDNNDAMLFKLTWL
jgi:hypothetical protein